MDVLAKAAVLGLTVSLLGLLLRRHAPELGLALSLGGCVAAAMLLFGLGQELRQGAMELYERTGLSAALVEPVVKCVGLGLVAKLAADLCRDAGQSALAGTVETAGAAAALCAALPLLGRFLELMGGLL
jgi:stage III sporulation protein AD